MRDLLIAGVREAGALLRDTFGFVREVRVKDSRSSVVTEADLAAEKLIVARIQAAHPTHNVIAEETGFRNRGSPFTWVIDPLDGTSNFAAGLPWFGVMLAVYEQNAALCAAMYLPESDILYYAERAGGAFRNGQPIRVTSETDLGQVLVAYGMDNAPTDELAARQAAALGRIVQHARNVRATNSLIDFAWTIDGRLGAFVNYHTKVWDIAAANLILQEAGGQLTDLAGNPIALDLTQAPCAASYAVLGANPALHRQLLALL